MGKLIKKLKKIQFLLILTIFTNDKPVDVGGMEQWLFLHLKVFLTKTHTCLGQKQQNFAEKSTSPDFYHSHILYTWGCWMHESWDVFSLTVRVWLPWQPENRHSEVKNSKILPQNQLLPISIILTYILGDVGYMKPRIFFHLP